MNKILEIKIENQIEGEQKQTYDDVDLYNDQIEEQEELEIQNQRSLL